MVLVMSNSGKVDGFEKRIYILSSFHAVIEFHGNIDVLTGATAQPLID